MKKHAIIVAGGSGNRMKSDIPKQFMLLNNLPILMHTISRLHHFDKNIAIIVVLPEMWLEEWMKLISKYAFNIQHLLAKGGLTRFESVKNGLAQIKTDGLVAIHDGVRPLVSIETLKRCFICAEENGSAIPVMPLIESIRLKTGNKSEAADRSQFVSVQTPQIFHVDKIMEAYKQPYSEDFTDDATVFESTGKKVCLVDGNRENIKITHPSDLLFAKALIESHEI